MSVPRGAANPYRRSAKVDSIRLSVGGKLSCNEHPSLERGVVPG